MFCHLRHKERPSTPQHRIVLDHRQDMGVRNVDRLQIVYKPKYPVCPSVCRPINLIRKPLKLKLKANEETFRRLRKMDEYLIA